MQRSFRDLTSRTKFVFRGADRVRFLNGQTTNDIRKAKADATLEAAVLNAKGMMEGHIFLFATPEAIWCDAAPELREKLPARLERYIIADDVQMEEMTDQFALFHFPGEQPPPFAEFCFHPAASRIGPGGMDAWVKAGDAEKTRASLREEGFEELTEERWETARIEAGRPRWNYELSDRILPPEAGLEERAIDYQKGCYIGQETISRLKMSGQSRQRLSGLIAEKEGPLLQGNEISADGRKVGRITSAVFSPSIERWIALALVKRGFNEIGRTLYAGEGNPVTVTALPFVAPR